MYFSKILAEDESVSVCKAYRVGPVGTNGDNHSSPLKVILSSEQDLKLLLSRRGNWYLLHLAFFYRNYSLSKHLK